MRFQSLFLLLFVPASLSSFHHRLRISDRGHSERRMRRASDSKINPKHNEIFESDDESENDEPEHRQMSRRKVRTSMYSEDDHNILIYCSSIHFKIHPPTPHFVL